MQIKINDNLTENIKDISVSTGGGVFNLSELNTYLLNLLYPIGSIYITTNANNPSTYFGGTWEAFGQGRTLVGIDTSQSEFNTLLKTGGATKVTHRHNLADTGYACIGSPSGNSVALGFSHMDWHGRTSTYSVQGTSNNADGHPGRSHDTYLGGSTNDTEISIMPPYICVYMWKRTA